jgi:hypothetical protein
LSPRGSQCVSRWPRSGRLFPYGGISRATVALSAIWSCLGLPLLEPLGVDVEGRSTGGAGSRVRHGAPPRLSQGRSAPRRRGYFWPDRRTMEHLWCHVRGWDTRAQVEASADPAYGPMS